MPALFAGAPWVVALVFVAAGVLHFVAPRVYMGIMPRWLPATGPFGHRSLVLVSGAFEILGGLGVLPAPTRRAAGYGLVVLLAAVLPANVEMLWAAWERGAPVWARALLVGRVPLQFLLMWWVLVATAR